MSDLQATGGRGAVRVNEHYLISELHLPEKTVIVDAEWDHMRGGLILTVEHPDLPKSFLWCPVASVSVEVHATPNPAKTGYDYSAKWVPE